jgi:phosphatidylglycerophosphate synthase
MASDFAEIPDGELNLFQRVAKRTNDIVTPANALDAVAAGLSVDGMRRIANKNYAVGIAELAGARVIDVIDGPLARWSETATSKGEIVDAALDKLEMLGIVAVGLSKKLISPRTAKRLVVQNGVNTIAAAVAKKRGHEIHSAKTGKHTMALQSVESVGEMISNSTDGLVSTVTETISKVAGEAWQPLGVMATGQYISDAIDLPPSVAALIETANDTYAHAVLVAREGISSAIPLIKEKALDLIS